VVAVDRTQDALRELPGSIRSEVADTTDPATATPLVDRLRAGIADNLRVGQLAAVNLRLPGDGRVDARFDDQLAALVAARDEDLIAGVVLSNVSLRQLRHAAAGTDIVCVQNLFHLADRSSTPVLRERPSRGIASRIR
jgi:pyridoxine 4-dehydrogenase